MSYPETGPETPDTTPHFQQLFGYTADAARYEQEALIKYIEGRPDLSQLLRTYLREDYELPWAIGMVRQDAAPEDEDVPHPFEQVIKRERRLIERQLGEALTATGLYLNPAGAPETSLHVRDMNSFGNAVRGLQLPAEDEQRDSVRRGLETIVTDSLYRTALTIRRQNPEGYVRVRGRPQPTILGAVGLSREDIDQIDAKMDPGASFVDTFLRRAPELAEDLKRLGVNERPSRTLDCLRIASEAELRMEWAVAYDLEIFGAGRIGADRLANEADWEEVIDFLDYLRRTAPGSDFTVGVRQQLLKDIEAELERPFDPNDPAEDSTTFLILPESDPRPSETEVEPENDEPDAFSAELEALLGELYIADEDSPEETVSPEQARAHRIERRQYIVQLLEAAREEVGRKLPLNPLRPQAVAAEAGEATETRTAASAADLAAAILAQEVTLYDAEQTLLGQQERLIDLHTRLSALLDGTQNPDAIMAVSGLTDALEHLKRFLTSSDAAKRHLRHYRP